MGGVRRDNVGALSLPMYRVFAASPTLATTPVKLPLTQASSADVGSQRPVQFKASGLSRLQSRSASLADVDERDLELRPVRRLGSAFTDDGTNVLLTKISYWLPM